MRIIVYGAGAVGSLIGGRLAQVGTDVVLVGRLAHVAAIRAGGLRLRTAAAVDTVAVEAVTALADLTPRPGDVMVITAKTQDTTAMHDAIAAWNANVPVVCGTNGVEHERMALRKFDRVYGMLVQLPCQFERPGEVTALWGPANAMLDVGRYPKGTDSLTEELAAIINTSPYLTSESDPDIMVKKHGKLLLNLGNAADAACGRAGRESHIAAAAYTEGQAIFTAAGIAFQPVGAEAQRYRDRLAAFRFDIPDGDTFLGGSTWQSLAKGATSLEVDYFNGEVLLQARRLGLPAPVNSFLLQLTRELLHDRIPPGSLSVDELDARWQTHDDHTRSG